MRYYLSQHIAKTKKAVSLGKPTRKKSAVFFNIVQKAFEPPPPFIWTFDVQ